MADDAYMHHALDAEIYTAAARACSVVEAARLVVLVVLDILEEMSHARDAPERWIALVLLREVLWLDILEEMSHARDASER